MQQVHDEIHAFKRPPETVMRLRRMGSLHATRISFMRTLVRRMAREGWRIERTRWALDRNGYGEAVYAVHTPRNVYSLVAISSELDDTERTDRVIAEKWDAAFALLDGEPDEADMVRLRNCLPLQEAGRCSSKEVVLSRANKSVRLFDYVVECLANGQQPDLSRIVEVGYLMRTTAVYGNGKFGAADRERIMQREEMSGPYRAEMLAVYLIRCFTHDLVDHIAHARGGDNSVTMARDRKRALGIGNATGLGMAPYLHKHPQLLNNWFDARETALARVRAQPHATPTKLDRFYRLLDRARRHVEQWRTSDRLQSERIEVLKSDLCRVAEKTLGESYPWHELMSWCEEQLSLEAQEMMASLLMEPHAELVDDLETSMAADERMIFEPSWTVGAFIDLIRTNYDWALCLDFTDPANTHWFWYVSEEKLEPRVGVRAEESGADKEMPLGVARDVQAVFRDLGEWESKDSPLGLFLASFPQHRHIVRRILALRTAPYGEIRDNLLAETMRPIDMLRSKLSFFGATKFDPKSDRWTRIAMYQNAPLPDELAGDAADDWCFPVIGAQETNSDARFAE